MNLFQQAFGGKGFLQEMHAFFEDTMMGYDVFGISRHIEHSDMRMKFAYLSVDLGAFHCRHNDVGQE